jgi:trehalose 6-phosphate synthase/phosphatase
MPMGSTGAELSGRLSGLRYPSRVPAPRSYEPGDDGPLVVLSNRLPFTVSRTQRGLESRPSPGGLVSALTPAIAGRGGTWIGWPGLALRSGEEVPAVPSIGYRVASVELSDSEVQRYYHGFSNGTLWPLFHSMPGHARFDRRDWQTYAQVNERFADAAVENATESGLLWIHDYHLMLAPSFIRQRLPRQRIGFFLHIPFPPYDVFRLCPWDRDLLQGLLGCDLIGFHIETYAYNFLDSVERLLGARVDRDAMTIEHGERAAQVGIFPIGIEFERFERQADEAQRRRTRERIVLGVDRLDYTKGIPERIRAFERLLERHPEHREEVVFLQLAVPSRSQVAEYRDLKREIDELVGQVNGKFATDRWSPIRYLYRSIPQTQLTALYRDADVALVTPLRDGMNLVAKEYVACQIDEPGVLILSHMAGAAETMREALKVNPYDIDEAAETLHRALTMGAEERASRMAALRRRERRDDVESWVNQFLTAAAAHQLEISKVTERDFERWLKGRIRDYRLVLFLDYDGTLAPLCEHPADALLPPETRAALDRCAAREDTDVTIVSGRALGDVRAMVGHEGLIYAGNHGLEIEGNGFGSYRHEDLVHYRERAEELAKALHSVERQGAWTEHKGPTLTFHVRQVPEPDRTKLLEEARALITSHGYQARNAHSALEARPPIGWDKGRAVLHVLRSQYGPSWSENVRVIYVGDDETDEDAFRFLSGLAITFRVGGTGTMTAATHRLKDVDAVGTLLNWIGKRSYDTDDATDRPR